MREIILKGDKVKDIDGPYIGVVDKIREDYFYLGGHAYFVKGVPYHYYDIQKVIKKKYKQPRVKQGVYIYGICPICGRETPMKDRRKKRKFCSDVCMEISRRWYNRSWKVLNNEN